MADPSGGHWKNIDEAKKLSQSMKIPGVFEEDFKRNNPIDRFPVAQAANSGTKIEWLREKTTLEDAVVEVNIGDQLSWSEDVEYEEKETQLNRMYIQRKLDHFVQGIYGNMVNYEAQMLLECEKGLRRKIGARMIYGDYTYGGTPKQFDGLHAWAAEHGTPYTAGSAYDPKNIDAGETALSLALVRIWVDSFPYGLDEILAPYEVLRWLDAAYQEKGFAGLATATAGTMAYLSMGINELGKRVLYWDGIPLTRTDFLVAEQVNTGTGASSDARALYSSGTKMYSLFGVKYGSGDVGSLDPGLVLAYGGTEGRGDLYKLVRFPELEDYDAGGIRLVSYLGMLLKSSLCLGRMFDITNAAVTV